MACRGRVVHVEVVAVHLIATCTACDLLISVFATREQLEAGYDPACPSCRGSVVPHLETVASIVGIVNGRTVT